MKTWSWTASLRRASAIRMLAVVARHNGRMAPELAVGIAYGKIAKSIGVPRASRVALKIRRKYFIFQGGPSRAMSGSSAFICGQICFFFQPDAEKRKTIWAADESR